MSKAPIVICAIMKLEGKYIREWCAFHRIAGVDKIYIYNNNVENDWEEALQPFLEDGFVEVMDWPMESPCQLQAYQNFINKHMGEDIWAAFIDCDEFLFAPQHSTLHAYFDQIPKSIAIGANWCCFGSGDQTEYSPQPVIERFAYRTCDNEWNNSHIKSIIRMNQQVQLLGTPHFFNVENKTWSTSGKEINGPFSTHDSSYLRINHYKTKSKPEFIDRCKKAKKADIPNYVLNWEHYNSVQAKAVHDITIQKYLPQLKKYLEELNSKQLNFKF
jgi:hypothetical protein